MPAYKRQEGSLDDAVRQRVLKISPAQIDRFLASEKVSSKANYRRGLKADAAIKAVIPIRAKSWSTDNPGWTEADTVALCGGSMQGVCIWTLNCTSVAAGWTVNRTTWNRSDTDNGGEFLNWHLVSHFADREVKVEQTRFRPDHKNDQAHIEQKNYTHV